MTGIILRSIWRLLVFGLVLLLALFTSFVVIPYLDRRLPIFPVILIAYLFLAYVGLPFVVRVWQLVFEPKHIPRYVTTSDGWAADPVNIAIVTKNERQLKQVFKRVGWFGADPATFKNSLREAYALLLDKPYPTAPFSQLYLFGRRFDVGFQLAYGRNKSPRRRHHVRFWQLVETPRSVDENNHFAYWFGRVKQLLTSKRTIWLGTAIDDRHPVGLRWRNLQFSHSNRADHVTERDYIIKSLEEAGLIKEIVDIKDGDPFKIRSQNIGASLKVDGYIKVIILKAKF